MTYKDITSQFKGPGSKERKQRFAERLEHHYQVAGKPYIEPDFSNCVVNALRDSGIEVGTLNGNTANAVITRLAPGF